MREDIITMSREEVKRLKITYKVLERQLTQAKAGEVLGISERQVRRLVKRVKEQGAKGLVHRNRGRPSPKKMTEEREEQIGLIIEESYRDFGPTLASEKLSERHGIEIGREKLRQIMITRGLWQVRRYKKKAHQWRERKHHYGEMIQMDGSHHDWLEGRGPEMVFMGYIDDATGQVYGRFYDYEGVYPAMDSLESYIRLYGIPVSLYLDKHSTYKTTRQPDLDELLIGESAQTQFERACSELGIRVIHAHSPQAKGRIERTFGTLQDRLIKEMRLEGIRTKEEASEFLQRYLPLYNKRFGKDALKNADLHIRLPKEIRLRDIFSIKGRRTITNAYTVKWKGRLFLIHSPTIAMRRRKVEVREHFNGQMEIKFNDRYLKFKEIRNQNAMPEPKARKVIVTAVKKKPKYIPPSDHPWKKHQPSLHHNRYLEKI